MQACMALIAGTTGEYYAQSMAGENICYRLGLKLLTGVCLPSGHPAGVPKIN